MRILALDLGERRIGVAVSDDDETFARGLGVIERNGGEVNRICEIATMYRVEKIVYGLPLRMDGSLSPRGEKMLGLITKLKEKLPLEFVPWDERLTTKEAENILIMANMSRAKRKRIRDKLAAQIILQSYLDSRMLKDTNCQE